jgi:uncharacterized protein involved in exopolysaccharide biosynthesis
MWRGLIAVVAVLAGAAVGWSLGKTEYRATSLIEVVPRIPKILYDVPENRAWTESELDDRIRTEASLILDPRVLSNALRQLRGTGLLSAEALAEPEAISARLRTGRLGETRFIEVSYVDSGAALCARLVDAVTANYLRLARERAQTRARSIVDVLEEQRVSLLRSLQDLAEQERARSDGRGADAMNALYAARIGHLQELDSQLLRARVDGESGSHVERLRSAHQELGEELRVIERMVRALRGVRREQDLAHERLREVQGALRARQIECGSPERAGRIRLVMRAEPPITPYRDTRAGLTVLGALLGGVVGLGVAAGVRR